MFTSSVSFCSAARSHLAIDRSSEIACAIPLSRSAPSEASRLTETLPEEVNMAYSGYAEGGLHAEFDFAQRIKFAIFLNLVQYKPKNCIMGARFYFWNSRRSFQFRCFANWRGLYGKSFFMTFDDLVSIWLLPIGGFLIAIYTGWVL